MKRILSVLLLTLIAILLCSCESSTIGIIGGADGPTTIMIATEGEKEMFEQITPYQAKSIIDSDEEYIILDVREQHEFDEGHIPGAVLLPYTQINDKAEDMFPDKDALILVYCRSGRRSKIAALDLAKLGYTNVREFGGIIDWPYETVK